MKLEFLKYFTVLASELHFGRAAEKLAITQPTLSAAIQSLEREIGVLLFHRDRTMVRLSPAGIAFLPEAQTTLNAYARAKNVAVAVESGMIGRLDIGFAASLIYRDALTIVNALTKEMPLIEMVLHEMKTTEQYERLIRGQLDAGFSNGLQVPAQLDCMPLKTDVYVLCMPDSHTSANGPVVDLRELSHEPFILIARETSPQNYDAVIAIFERAGIHPRLAHRTFSWMTIIAMVGEGCGLAIVPSSMARANIAGVRFVPLADSPISVPAVLVWNPELVSSCLQQFLGGAKRIIDNRKLG